MDWLLTLASLLVTVTGINQDEKERSEGATTAQHSTQAQDKKSELSKRLLDKIAALIERADADQLERLEEIVDKVTASFPAERAKSARPYIGFYMAPLDGWEKEMLAKHGIKGGIKVGQIIPGSPAEKAGLKTGDIILAAQKLINHTASTSQQPQEEAALTEFDDLTRFLEKCMPSDRVRFSVMRDGSMIDIHLTLGEAAAVESLPLTPWNIFPHDSAGGSLSQLERRVETLTKVNEKLRNIIRNLKDRVKSLEDNTSAKGRNMGRPYIGIRVSELDEDDLLRMIRSSSSGADSFFSGMKITSVENGSPAQKAGLAKGDIIVSINQRNIETFEDIEAILWSARPADQLAVKVIRKDGAVTTFTVTLEGRK